MSTERLAAALGATPVAVEPVERGYTAAERWVVTLPGGARAFVKAAVNELTAGWLRAEHRVYSELDAAFLPRLLGWHDDGVLPVLALEDLSGAEWPPPWPPGAVEAVLAALEEVAAAPAPHGLPRLEAERAELEGWERVVENPGPFISLGLVSETWLERALPELVAVSAAAPLGGEALLHLDVRSDNICLRDGQSLLVDWNMACVGNARFDVAFWAPSLRLEGGPEPEELLGDEVPELAAFVAGFFAGRAGEPPIPDAPGVRGIQLAQLRVALPWASRELGLPAPDRG